MGRFNVQLEIGSPDGQRYETVEALVDIGASYTMIPDSLLRQLEVPVHDQVPFVLADGSRILRDVGQTWIRINGKSVITLVVFGNDGADGLLGAYAPQGLLLAVDTPNEQLISVPGLLK